MVTKVAREYGFNDLEAEGWIEETQRNMENGFRARPQDIREQYESELQEIREALGEVHLQTYALKKFKRLLDEDENS